jgi:succinate-semialdehyde dehydrogenase/glutarate-semialdehyde dehydrogenase
MPIAAVNPATGRTIRSFSADSSEVLETKLTRAAGAFVAWARTPVQARADLLARVAAEIESRRELLARLCTDEMGKPIVGAREELAKCAQCCRHYAEEGPRLLAPERVAGPGQEVWFAPLGPILAVMPWNFPFWQVFRFAAPALVAGNVGLLKHASNVPQCALAIEDLFVRAGVPAGVFQTLLIESQAVSGLIADRRVSAVTLTGSEAAGRSIATEAGKHLKKVVLELGGSDPYIVLADADVERAADVAVKARTISNGQSCIAAKRFIVVDAVHDRFVARFVAGMRRLRVGDPAREDTELGPLATPGIRDEVARQVTESVAAGARIVLGGATPTGPGNFYPATVLVDVPPDCPVAREEVFGPVAPVFRVDDAAAALALANDSGFGLGASVWTSAAATAAELARALEVGTVFINGMVASDVRFPFGGIKRSGYGRELGSYGIRELVNVKTVRLSLPDAPPTASE